MTSPSCISERRYSSSGLKGPAPLVLRSMKMLEESNVYQLVSSMMPETRTREIPVIFSRIGRKSRFLPFPVILRRKGFG